MRLTVPQTRAYTHDMAPRKIGTAAAEVASHCACFSLRKAARAATQVYDKTLAPSGLRVTQFTLMVALSLSEELTLSQVAERLVMDRTTLTRNVAPLERNGLVVSERGPDRRERYMRLTPAGRRVLAEALPLWRRAQAQAVAGIGHGAWRALRRGLAEFTTACAAT
jgi:DNA-binding MarR family transcriptional regulator